MGVDLRLLVVDGNCGTWGYSHTMLSLDRDYDMHDEIKKQEPQAAPRFELQSFCGTVPDGSHAGERGYGKTTETPYGNPITYLASQKVAAALAACKKLSRLNTSCKAFVEALPTDTLIGLYWH